MKKKNLLIISIVCFVIAGFASLGLTQDFQLDTADNTVSSIDDAEFIDVRTVRVAIKDVVADLAESRAIRDKAAAEIVNLNFDIDRARTNKDAQVAIRDKANVDIAALLVIVTDLRALAADLKLAPVPTE